jgi:hypothetical protein
VEPKWLQVAVDQACVGVQQQQVGTRLELRHHAREPAGVPHVVLVAQRDEFMAAGAHGLLEIARNTQRRRVAEHAQIDLIRHAALRQRVAHHGKGVVGRAVVGQHDLARQRRLRADAANLLGEVARAVAGAQRDGDCQRHQTGARRGGQA